MEPNGKLVLSQQGRQDQEFALLKTKIALGRSANNDIVIRDPGVSRTHACLEWGDAGWKLVDLGSANGTRVNGVAMGRAPIAPGDTIEMGASRLTFEATPLRAAPEVAAIESEQELDTLLASATLSTSINSTQLPRLAIHTAERTWEVPFDGDALTIGRGAENSITISDSRVSRQHARIERRGDVFTLRDLDTTNGTWSRGSRIAKEVLQDGDTFRIGAAQFVFKRGFAVDDLTVVDHAAPAGAASPRRPVVIVPGLMGTELWRGSEKLWPNVKLLFSRPDVFRLPQTAAMEPRGLVEEVVIVPNLIKLEEYGPLVDYLEEGLGYERGKDLLIFGYDWRQDVRASAQRLAEAVDAWKITLPITIIAHSLGCLVSRYYVDCLGGREHVGRLVLMGGPHAGAPKALSTLVLRADLLPFGLMGERLRQVLVTFPSMYQILPTYACAVDQRGQSIEPLQDEAWLDASQVALLRSAREFRRELSARPGVPTISIFGYGMQTLTKVVVERDPGGSWKKVNLALDARGDNTIPESSAMLEGSEIHPVRQYHGALYVDSDVKMRLKVELTR